MLYCMCASVGAHRREESGLGGHGDERGRTKKETLLWGRGVPAVYQGGNAGQGALTRSRCPTQDWPEQTSRTLSGCCCMSGLPGTRLPRGRGAHPLQPPSLPLTPPLEEVSHLKVAPPHWCPRDRCPLPAISPGYLTQSRDCAALLTLPSCPPSHPPLF